MLVEITFIVLIPRKQLIVGNNVDLLTELIVVVGNWDGRKTILSDHMGVQ